MCQLEQKVINQPDSPELTKGPKTNVNLGRTSMAVTVKPKVISEVDPEPAVSPEQEKINYLISELKKDGVKDIPKMTETLEGMSNKDLVKLADAFEKENPGKNFTREFRNVLNSNIQNFPDEQGNFAELALKALTQVNRYDVSVGADRGNKVHEIMSKSYSEWTSEEKKSFTSIMKSLSNDIETRTNSRFVASLEAEFKEKHGESLSAAALKFGRELIAQNKENPNEETAELIKVLAKYFNVAPRAS